MPIATIGTVVKVTPGDRLQIIRARGVQEFVEDRTPFKVRVSDLLREDGVLIGVAGPINEGHARYHGLIATLLTRPDDSDWETEVRSSANFKIGPCAARRITGFPHRHPNGTEIDSYPYFVRFGSIEAET